MSITEPALAAKCRWAKINRERAERARARIASRRVWLQLAAYQVSEGFKKPVTLPYTPWNRTR